MTGADGVHQIVTEWDNGLAGGGGGHFGAGFFGEGGGEVAFAGAGGDDDDFLAGGGGALGDFEGSPDGGAAGDADGEAFLDGEALGGAKASSLVTWMISSTMAVLRLLRDEAGADALDFVGAGFAAGDDGAVRSARRRW